MDKIKSRLNSPGRIVVFIICLVLILGVIAFGAYKIAMSALNNKGVGLEKATQIAMEHAQVDAKTATMVKGSYDKEDNISVFDVEFRAGGYEFEYVIGAEDGAIIESDWEPLPGQIVESTTPEETIDLEKAKTLALQEAGIQAADASFTKAVQERDEKINVYDIEFVSGDTKYSYEIDAATGVITEKGKEIVHG